MTTLFGVLATVCAVVTLLRVGYYLTLLDMYFPTAITTRSMWITAGFTVAFLAFTVLAVVAA